MDVASDDRDGAYVCEAGTGKVLAISGQGETVTLARGLSRPTDVHRLDEGSLIVSEAGAGRVVHLRDGHSTTLIDGLAGPHGVTSTASGLFVLDYAAATLHLLPVDGSDAPLVASNLPVGHSCGGGPEGLPGVGAILPGPILPFGGLAALPDGSVALSADSVGGILKLSPRPIAIP